MDAGLEIGLLGEVRVLRDGEAVELPQSKKTRALLAYLAVTAKPQRRDRLCDLLWDVADDPRGALRWCLSKLRPLVNDDIERLKATREEVVFEAQGALVDLHLLCAAEPGKLSDDELERLLAQVRGEFLEGLELTEFTDFHGWVAGQRETARRAHARLLAEGVRRKPDPDSALPLARRLAHVDPFSQPVQAQLVRLLVAAGRHREAQNQLEAARRLLAELGEQPGPELLQATQVQPRTPAAEPARRAETATAIRAPLVGRDTELGEIAALAESAREKRRAHGLLLSGPPGIGKSRLMDELAQQLARAGATVLAGRSFEIEQDRPYGPWIDALGRISKHAIGAELAGELAPLLGAAARQGGSREQLFGAISELIAARAHSAPPVVLMLDDVQWLDAASIELLHYAVRTNKHRPLLLLLAGRAGELPDNDAALRLVRQFNRDGLLHERELAPLHQADAGKLIRSVAPDADADAIFRDSGGNPLFALELARGAQGRDSLPASITGAIRERTETLPDGALEILRWGAVVGCFAPVDLLAELANQSPEQLVEALEILERYALMQSAPDARTPLGAFSFPHEITRRAIYDELSGPRRRLMHLKVAQLLAAREDPDGRIAADVAHHASQAGEFKLAAESCVTAGRRCLRLYAGSEADGFARRGMAFAAKLDDPQRTRLMLELHEVQLGARKPEKLGRTADELQQLAEHALDLGCLEHARLGFHMAAWLRWEGGEWGDAQRQMMRAEVASRDAGPEQRALAMAEAARCLAMLERDLGQAEALLLEANAMARRSGVESAGMLHAAGMLRLHEGKVEEAAGLFERAQSLARARGDRVSEFQVLDHRLLLELERGNTDAALPLAKELLEIGQKLRGGSEAPCAAVMLDVARQAAGQDAQSEFERDVAQLREVDAKQHLLHALIQMAALDVRQARTGQAAARATEALQLAELLQRLTDAAAARLLLLQAAEANGDTRAAKQQVAALGKLPAERLARKVREKVEAVAGAGRSR
ncbi:MAG: AAA family ATPase [Planctomycetes bacterium]|nr:AAA family ATPase [Planctomycetota bacterium]MCB9936117.1 AAA family ATPase [Planctomycetota bacterium]